MITKMKKLTFLVYHKEYEDFLKRIRDLGVLHIQKTQEGSDDSSALQERVLLVNRIKQMIDNFADVEPSKQQGNPNKGPAVMEHIEKLQTEKQQQEALVQSFKKEEDALKIWGNFDPKNIERLKENGFEIRFFTCPKRSFQPEWENEYYATLINTEGDRLFFITITPVGATSELDAEVVTLPQRALNDVIQEKEKHQRAAAAIEEQIQHCMHKHIKDLQEWLTQLRSSVAFDQVVLATEKAAEDKVMILEGWIPAPKEQMVRDFLNHEEVYYEVREAHKGDHVPVLLRNNAFTRMYEVLTDMYGMPDYDEFDPTPMIAPFFTLFFAFCMGDAGYGIALILLGFFLKKKLSKSMAGMMNLVITLGIATTLFGAILGTFFGVDLFKADIPEWMKQFMITGKIGETNYDKQMLLALIIGVVHICIAMTVKAIGNTVRFSFKESLSDWGWLLLVVGFVTLGSLSFFKLIPEDITFWGFIIVGGISAIGIYLLNNINRNVFVNIGAGLWDTYNMATGLMGDVLSYIRLYALGLAGAMLGGVFNQLAFMVEDAAGGIPGLIFCGLILVFGHTLNIAMSCLSAFVHPLRLTFVEYFKNSGYDGKGEAYKPFAVAEKEED